MEGIKALSNDYSGFVLSSATMRSEDVLPAFSDFLTDHAEECNIVDRVDSINADIGGLKHIPDDDGDLVIDWDNEDNRDTISFLINEDIWYLLDEIAPPGHHFSAHMGDGSCYGYWREVEHLMSSRFPPVFTRISEEVIQDETGVDFRRSLSGCCANCFKSLTEERPGYSDDFEVSVHSDCIQISGPVVYNVIVE